MTKYLHTMIRVSSLEDTIALPAEPWKSMPNTGSW
jgi:hypothetical protein